MATLPTRRNAFHALSLGLWGLLVFGGPCPASAQTAIPYVVRDLFLLPAGAVGDYQPGVVVEFNGFAYFTAKSGVNGRELWRTDGTSGGTTLVRDINPGLGDSNPADLTVCHGVLYFSADDGTHARELWRSDGTASGTRMVADLSPSPSSGGPTNLVSVNGKLLFKASSTNPPSGMGLVYDGATLTSLYLTGACCLPTGSCTATSSALCSSQNGMWGGVNTPCTSVACNQPVSIACCMPDKACVYATSANCTALGGTPRALNTPCGSCPDPALFTCCLPGGSCSVVSLQSCLGSSGAYVFLSSGCSPNPCSAAPMACCLPSGQCFMVRLASDCASHAGVVPAGTNTCLPGATPSYCAQVTFTCCRTNGTCTTGASSACSSLVGLLNPVGTACSPGLCFVPNTTMVTPTSGTPIQFGERAAIFATTTSGREIWMTDGTAPGCTRIATGFTSLTLTADWPKVVGNKLFFLVNSGALWCTDGTAAGTAQVQLPWPLWGGGNGSVCASGDYLYFGCVDSSGFRQLARTDGTPGWTGVVSSFTDFGADPGNLLSLNGGVLFTATGANSRRHWWYTDGTPAGTRELGVLSPFTPASVERPAVAFGGRAYFAGWTVVQPDPGLWSTDGTPAGTQQVFPDPAAPQNGIAPTTFGVALGRVFFQATDQSDFEHAIRNVLWSTIGTRESTAIVAIIQGNDTGVLTAMTAGGGDDLYFAGQGSTTQGTSLGVELFKTSGIPGSTQMVMDIYAGLESTHPSKLTYHDGTLLFNAYDGTPGDPYVYRSDGTLAGTYRLGSVEPHCCGGARATNMVTLGNHLYYFDATPQTGWELWRTDGTTQGTGLFAEAAPGSADGVYEGGNIQSVEYGGLVYYVTLDGVFRTDGTPAGTVRLTTFNRSVSPPGAFFPTSAGLFFRGTAGSSLWKTDGAPAGTAPIVPGDVPPYSIEGLVATAEGRLFFYANDQANGRELWTSDGTAAGTRVVVDLVPGNGGPNFGTLAVHGNKAYFLVRTSTSTNTNDLYESDGTPAGTRLALTPADFPRTIEQMWPGNGCLLIAALDTSPSRRHLWSFSGTTASLTNLTPAFFGTYTFSKVSVAGAHTYFTRLDSSVMWGLFRTDGTPGGIVQVTPNDPWLQSSSLGVTGGLVAVGNDVYFTAVRDGTRLLYRTTFPTSGIVAVSGVRANELGPPTVPGGPFYFRGNSPPEVEQLFVTDGSPAGTRVVSAMNTAPFAGAAGAITKTGELFFYQPTGGNSIYRSDGTPAGTYRVCTLASAQTSLADSADVNGTLYFSGTDLAAGAELWRTNGTVPGTSIAVDIVPGANNSGPSSIRRIGNRLFLSAYAIVNGANVGQWPYVSDGSPSGTSALVDQSSAGGSTPRFFADLQGLAIYSASTASTGHAVFRSDGSPAGTYWLVDLSPGTAAIWSSPPTVAGNLAYFIADDGVRGRELWRTDGTVPGTVLVRDICPGDLGSAPAQIVAAGDRVYFAAYTPETGIELWTSDGTAAGTFMLFEIVPGPSSANLRNITVAGNRIYFVATVPPQPASLWSFDWGGGLAGGFICISDYNRSGQTSVQDIFDFLGEWFGGIARADIDGSGAISVGDLFAFLSHWFAGC